MNRYTRYTCSDGFCGADDCTKCGSEWWPEEEPEEEEEEEETTCSLINWAGSTHDITY